MFSIFALVFGLAVGSFLNVLIDRLPEGESIMGRSHCDHCKKQLHWFELIPVFSFLVQGGRSRCCHKKISFQYPLVEIITGILFLLIFNFQSIFNQFSKNNLQIKNLDLISNFKFQISNFSIIILFGIVSCLIVIFFADLKFQIIPDSIQVAFFIFSIISKFQIPNSKFQIWNYLAAGLIVMLPILFLYLMTKGRGMGFGDVKLAFTVGVLLGIKGGLIAFYLAFVIGAVVGLFLLIFKSKGLKSKIAFGPFIVLGTVMVFFLKAEIFSFINRIYGF